MENKFVLKLKSGLLLSLLSLLAIACHMDQKENTRLIVIDEMVYTGVKIQFYLGSDSSDIFNTLSRNEFKLDYVDSNYIYVLNKDEFNKLNKVFSMNDIEYNYNNDSIAKAQPRIIRVRFYDDKLLSSQEFLNDDFSNFLQQKWEYMPTSLSVNAINLLRELKAQTFIKDSTLGDTGN